MPPVKEPLLHASYRSQAERAAERMAAFDRLECSGVGSHIARMAENYSVLVAAPESVFISLGIFEAEDDEDARIKLGDFIRKRAKELRPEDVIHLSKDEDASEICPPSTVAEYLSPSI